MLSLTNIVLRVSVDVEGEMGAAFTTFDIACSGAATALTGEEGDEDKGASSDGKGTILSVV